MTKCNRQTDLGDLVERLDAGEITRDQFFNECFKRLEEVQKRPCSCPWCTGAFAKETKGSIAEIIAQPIEDALKAGATYVRLTIIPSKI